MEEPSQFSLGQKAQSLTCSIMEKPHSGLDGSRRMLLHALEKRCLTQTTASTLDPSELQSTPFSALLQNPLILYGERIFIGGGRIWVQDHKLCPPFLKFKMWLCVVAEPKCNTEEEYLCTNWNGNANIYYRGYRIL